MPVLASPSPSLPHVHSNSTKNLLSSLELDLDHDINGHKLPQPCERGTVQIEHLYRCLLFRAKVFRIKALTNQDRL